nr:unnamed protein product [Digitaria exilis]
MAQWTQVERKNEWWSPMGPLYKCTRLHPSSPPSNPTATHRARRRPRAEPSPREGEERRGRRLIGAMCYQVKCGTCGKPTWAGCGRHIPAGQHCACRDWPGVAPPAEKKATDAAAADATKISGPAAEARRCCCCPVRCARFPGERCLRFVWVWPSISLCRFGSRKRCPAIEPLLGRSNWINPWKGSIAASSIVVWKKRQNNGDGRSCHREHGWNWLSDSRGGEATASARRSTELYTRRLAVTCEKPVASQNKKNSDPSPFPQVARSAARLRYVSDEFRGRILYGFACATHGAKGTAKIAYKRSAPPFAFQPSPTSIQISVFGRQQQRRGEGVLRAVKCGACGKSTWAGCGRHIPEGQHCACRDWPGVAPAGDKAAAAGDAAPAAEGSSSTSEAAPRRAGEAGVSREIASPSLPNSVAYALLTHGDFLRLPLFRYLPNRTQGSHHIAQLTNRESVQCWVR